MNIIRKTITAALLAVLTVAGTFAVTVEPASAWSDTSFYSTASGGGSLNSILSSPGSTVSVYANTSAAPQGSRIRMYFYSAKGGSGCAGSYLGAKYVYSPSANWYSRSGAQCVSVQHRHYSTTCQCYHYKYDVLAW